MAKAKSAASVKEGLFSRGVALAKLGLRASALATKRNLRKTLADPKGSTTESIELLKEFAERLTKELGQMKGSAMKVGQLLSTYGEHFLPTEVNSILKNLQSKATPMEWSDVEPLILRELGRERMDRLSIDENPLASASIGQVHRARRRDNGAELALKIQYPGVDRAIQSDIFLLKTILSLTPLVPRGPRLNAVIAEVRAMLERETDYLLELASTERVSIAVAWDPRLRVPRVDPEFSSHRILATSYLHGANVDSPEVQNLSLPRRNRLGLAFLEHYLRELLQYRFVQTDAHLGNYRIEIDPNGSNDRLIMLDFGAMREVTDEFWRGFRQVLLGSVSQNSLLVEAGGNALGILEPSDSRALVQKYVELCYLITEPFADPTWEYAPARFMNSTGEYRWDLSDLPTRVVKQGAQMALGQPLRAPPAETVFLDRKLGGAFIFLAKLGCQINARALILDLLNRFS